MKITAFVDNNSIFSCEGTTKEETIKNLIEYLSSIDSKKDPDFDLDENEGKSVIKYLVNRFTEGLIKANPEEENLTPEQVSSALLAFLNVCYPRVFASLVLSAIREEFYHPDPKADSNSVWCISNNYTPVKIDKRTIKYPSSQVAFDTEEDAQKAIDYAKFAIDWIEKHEQKNKKRNS